MAGREQREGTEKLLRLLDGVDDPEAGNEAGRRLDDLDDRVRSAGGPGVSVAKLTTPMRGASSGPASIRARRAAAGEVTKKRSARPMTSRAMSSP